MPDGEYVLLSQVAEIIAAKDARIKELHDAGHDSFKTAIGWQQRAEAAEGELITIANHLDCEADIDSILHTVREIEADKDIYKERTEAAETKLAQYEYVDEDGDVCIVMQQSEIDLANENLSLYEEVETLKNLLSQYEVQEPVGYTDSYGLNGLMKNRLSFIHVSKSRNDDNIIPLYASPAPAADMKAENDTLKTQINSLIDEVNELQETITSLENKYT